MSTVHVVLAAALVIADLLICTVIGFRTRGNASDADDYFIGGKKTGVVLLFLTAWASFSGSGNFIGQAGRGAMQGISAYWLWLGEGFLGGIIMGYLLAPYLARFKYLSMPHFISGYLFGGDKYIRRVGGIAALMPNLVWPGAQIMGVAYVLEQIFGIDYRIACIVCGVVFIFYTVSGGLEAVIYADAVHGTIQMIFAAVVIYFGLKSFHFDPGFLRDGIMAVDPSKWDLFVDRPFVIATSFLTGLVGAVSNPIFWNRAFAAKDVKTAKQAYGVTFFMNIILVFLMIAIGISSLMFTNAGDRALVWMILNKMPPICGVIAGFGCGLVLRGRSSGGGQDIIGMCCSKRYQNLSVGKINIAMNLCIYGICLFLFNVEIVAYSLIYSLMLSVATDRVHIQNINTSALIFTKKPGVAEAIIREVGRGVTAWEGTGAYTNEPAHIFSVVLSKYEVNLIRHTVKSIDPGAFMIFTEGCTVDGNFEKRLLS